MKYPFISTLSHIFRLLRLLPALMKHIVLTCKLFEFDQRAKNIFVNTEYSNVGCAPNNVQYDRTVPTGPTKWRKSNKWLKMKLNSANRTEPNWFESTKIFFKCAAAVGRQRLEPVTNTEIAHDRNNFKLKIVSARCVHCVVSTSVTLFNIRYTLLVCGTFRARSVRRTEYELKMAKVKTINFQIVNRRKWTANRRMRQTSCGCVCVCVERAFDFHVVGATPNDGMSLKPKTK